MIDPLLLALVEPLQSAISGQSSAARFGPKIYLVHLFIKNLFTVICYRFFHTRNSSFRPVYTELNLPQHGAKLSHRDITFMFNRSLKDNFISMALNLSNSIGIYTANTK